MTKKMLATNNTLKMKKLILNQSLTFLCWNLGYLNVVEPFPPVNEIFHLLKANEEREATKLPQGQVGNHHEVSLTAVITVMRKQIRF